MRLTVTPIGSTGRSASSVAADVVAYLEAGKGAQRAGSGLFRADVGDGPGGGVVGYYADSIEGPGRWLGRGARRLGLAGEVDRVEFQRVLEGRHPRTGERLLGARGSAGRRHLGVGSGTRRGPDGTVLYDLRDAAKALGRTRREVEALIAPSRARDGRVRDGRVDGTGGVRIVTVDGERFVTEDELGRLAGWFDHGVAGDVVRCAGPPDEELSLVEAAALSGLRRDYLRRCCQTWERTIADGGQPPKGRAWLACRRGTGPRRPYRVTRGELAAFVDRRRPPAVRVGYDLTLSTEKSVAVAAMLSVGPAQEAVLGAIDAANRVAIDYLEHEAAFTRHRGRRVATEGLVVASYLHGTSRALDPFPHRHNVVANAACDANGDRKALDGRALYRHAAPAAALATAEMRWLLTTRLGVTWRRSGRGRWELDGISDDVIDEFSTRRRELDEAIAELEQATGRPGTGADRDRLALATRDPKQPTSRAELLAGWWRRANAHGLSAETLTQTLTGSGTGQTVHPRLSGALEAELGAHLAGPAGVTAERSVFTRGDVIRSITQWARPDQQGADRLVVVPAREVTRLADRFLASRLVVELHPARSDHDHEEPTFCTASLLEIQAGLLARFNRRDGTGASVPGPVIDEVLAGSPLSDEQARWVAALTAGGERFGCAVGRPGTGKTFSVAYAAAAWEAAGYRVLGAAVKGEAARHLGDEAGIASETVAWYLTKGRGDPERAPLDARTVLVVDEASTLSDRDLDGLCRLVERTGATVRLVGDPAQHGSVAAGGSFAALCAATTGIAELVESRRLADPVERAAAEAVRHGRIGEALDQLRTTGKVTEADDPRSAHLVMLQRWLTARRAGHPHPMVDRRNATRRVLNQLAQRLLQAEGHVDTTGLAASEDRLFCTGDEVIARRGNRDLHPPGRPQAWVRNGTPGRVIATHHGATPDEDRLDVEFAGIGPIEVGRAFFDRHHHSDGHIDVGLDHAYAVTSYAIQGATYEESTSAITTASTNAELYVDLTRGRTHNHLVLTRTAPDAEAHLPREDPLDVVTEIAAALGRPGQHTAHTLDPDALHTHRLRADRTLAELHTALDDARRSGADQHTITTLARAEANAAAAAGRAALADTPPELLRRLPRRPDTPWQARHWDHTLALLATHRARWGSQRPAPNSPTATRWRAELDQIGTATDQLHQWAADHEHRNHQHQPVEKSSPLRRQSVERNTPHRLP